MKFEKKNLRNVLNIYKLIFLKSTYQAEKMLCIVVEIQK